MTADPTPALPGEAPDPSATPRLDALLREVGVRAARGQDILSVLGYTEGLKEQVCEHRLAAIVRVLVEQLALIKSEPKWNGHDAAWQSKLRAHVALARAEAIAKGE
jgi:hypothetical protein